ncbi:metal ABC transporter substrate-binding protein, partial [Bacillus sp. D-CC]
VTVEAIYPPGADSHTFEPSQKQTVQVAKADLFVYNGAELEHHDHGDGHKEDEHHHDKDPHIWLDPTLAMKQAEKIKNALVLFVSDLAQ